MRSSPHPAWLVCCLLSLIMISSVAARAADQTDDYELMRLFVDTFEEIDQNYVKDINRRELIEAAIAGMLAKLDPYSNYISPDDLTSFEQNVEQEFGGIGIQVHFDPDHRELIVMTPLPGSPAYQAGIRAGDRILKIEGKDVVEFELGKELSTAVSLLKGPAGDKVTLTIRHELPADTSKPAPSRDNSDESEDLVGQEPKKTEVNVETIEVTRDIIKMATVMGDHYNADGTWNFMIDPVNKIGYIRLTHFSRNSTSEMHAALKQLEKQGFRGLILDLRWNPGGLLTSAVEISDLFVDSGKIVSTKGRNTAEKTWRARKRGTFTGFPMAVLVNRFSASASEILSACLQDHDRAVVVGERSWGKGSVQNVIELESGSSALKLTTASYHRPSGKNIHRFPKAKEEDEWGVMPNEGYKVQFTTQQMIDYRKFRSERDVLDGDGPPESDYVDTQYVKALEYVVQELTEPAGEKGPKEEKKAEEPAVKASDGKEAAQLPRTYFVIPRRDTL